uniref:Lipocalin/cytosolic fatty-acid binding domain-containing protein n=1 Tax=viral metagenome TaxID=1070528 RepID=A0A6C0AU29_9ZZZZ
MYSYFTIALFCVSLFYSKLGLSLIESNPNNFTTVSELDVSLYTGHWYQVYAAPVDFTFQGPGKCITADYGILGNNNVSVYNYQENLQTGSPESISGYAFYKNLSEPGQLSVYLEGAPFIAPYWVLNLGPVSNNQYSWSIVSVPFGSSLWVLARNVELFFSKYDDDVVKLLNQYGFKYFIVEQDDC